MPRPAPKRPTGSDSEAVFMQAVWDEVFGPASQFIDSSTVKISRGTKGKSFHAAPAGNNGTALLQCVVTTLIAGPGAPYDYLGITEYDAVNGILTGPQFLCAKCITGQCPNTELIDGNQISYVYTDDNTRVASQAGSPSEGHKMHNRYIAYPVTLPGLPEQAILYAQRVRGNALWVASDPIYSGQQITFVEVNSRFWALIASYGGS